MNSKRVAQVLLYALACAFTAFAEPQKPESDICEVHHLKMSRQQVEIRYGLPNAHDMEFLQATYAKFPHSGMPLEGGCVIGDNSPRSAEVFVCPRCHTEAVAWLEEHKEPQRPGGK
jgi:hypothetical protein